MNNQIPPKPPIPVQPCSMCARTTWSPDGYCADCRAMLRTARATMKENP